jgi:hypothetical protein
MNQLTDEQRREAADLARRASAHRDELREIEARRFRLSEIALGIDPDAPKRLTKAEAKEKIVKLRRVTVKRGASPNEEAAATEGIRRLEAEYFPTERLEKAWREVLKVAPFCNSLGILVIEDEQLFQKRLRKLIDEAQKLIKSGE